MHLVSQRVARIRQDTPHTQGYKTPPKASCRGGKVWGDVGFVVLRDVALGGVALHCLALLDSWHCRQWHYFMSDVASGAVICALEKKGGGRNGAGGSLCFCPCPIYFCGFLHFAHDLEKDLDFFGISL